MRVVEHPLEHRVGGPGRIDAIASWSPVSVSSASVSTASQVAWAHATRSTGSGSPTGSAVVMSVARSRSSSSVSTRRALRRIAGASSRSSSSVGLDQLLAEAPQRGDRVSAARGRPRSRTGVGPGRGPRGRPRRRAHAPRSPTGATLRRRARSARSAIHASRLPSYPRHRGRRRPRPRCRTRRRTGRWGAARCSGCSGSARPASSGAPRRSRGWRRLLRPITINDRTGLTALLPSTGRFRIYTVTGSLPKRQRRRVPAHRRRARRPPGRRSTSPTSGSGSRRPR